MKFAIERAALLEILDVAANVAERKSTMPILSNVLLRADKGTVTVAATDTTQISTWASLPAEVSVPGASTVLARDMARIVGGLERERIEVSAVANGRVEIRAGKQRYEMVSLAARDFPKMPVAPDMVHVHPAPMAKMIGAVMASVGHDASRMHLQCVCLAAHDGKTRAVTTDGHRAATYTDDIGNFSAAFPILVPEAGAKMIAKLVAVAPDATAAVEKGLFFVRVGAVTIAVKLFEAQFPPIDQVIPKDYELRAVVDAGAMSRAVKRLLTMLEGDKEAGVKMTFVDGDVTLSVRGVTKGDGVEELECKQTGPALTIGSNGSYLVDALAGIEGDAAIEMRGELDPIKIVPAAGGAFLAVVMPQRI